MKIKRFTAVNMQSGLKIISETLGPEAVILSNRRLSNGLEIIAGVDEAEYELYEATRPPKKDETEIIKVSVAPDEPLDKQTMQQLFKALGSSGSKNDTEKSMNRQDRQFSGLRSDRASKTHSKSKDKNQPMTSIDQNDHRPASEIDLLRQEIDGLKSLLTEKSFPVSDHPVSTKTSSAVQPLEARLLTLGFTDRLTQQLLESYDRHESVDRNWSRVMRQLSGLIGTPLSDPLKRGGVVSLLGPTGAGKTTTIAKLAAHGVKDFGAQSVAVISLDWYQVGGQQILSSVTRILGVDFFPLQEGDSLSAVLNKLDDKKLVLIDTSGSVEALSHWNEITCTQSFSRQIQSVLVLPCTMNAASLTQFVARHQSIELAAVILTKLDESSCFGGVLDLVVNHRWAVWYCATGQNIPQDIEVANAHIITQRLDDGLMEEPAYAEAMSL